MLGLYLLEFVWALTYHIKSKKKKQKKKKKKKRKKKSHVEVETMTQTIDIRSNGSDGKKHWLIRV